MAREFKRTDRVSEQLQRELAQIIQMEIKDPRVGMVTVSGVDVSRDLYYATVYVTFMGIDEDKKTIAKAIDILNQAAGYVRSLIGKRMKMRVIPNIKFAFDGSIARGSELSALIQQAREKDGDDLDEATESNESAESNNIDEQNPAAD